MASTLICSHNTSQQAEVDEKLRKAHEQALDLQDQLAQVHSGARVGVSKVMAVIAAKVRII